MAVRKVTKLPKGKPRPVAKKPHKRAKQTVKPLAAAHVANVGGMPDADGMYRVKILTGEKRIDWRALERDTVKLAGGVTYADKDGITGAQQAAPRKLSLGDKLKATFWAIAEYLAGYEHPTR